MKENPMRGTSVNRASALERFEGRIVRQFRGVFGEDEVYRGADGDTVFPDGPGIECPLFWVEDAYGADANLEETLGRARQKCCLDRWLLAVVQRPGKEPLIAMTLKDFLDLVRRRCWLEPTDLESSEPMEGEDA